ncbi:uncharacterized protein [Phaseolus vulgaris]|uniref:uncharacterized protein n=1 Tax=Phaseolus vulgaris TaxID=3885 RepID=UPI0035C9D069
MGFHSKWISWIRGCMESATISVLVNGSPTEEFKPSRGLRQGDPLAPFLFVVVAEGLAGLVRALVAVCKSITRIQRRFLWGLGKEKESISWVSWKVLCKPREEGGLGLRDIRMFNSTLLTKWRWHLMGGRAREMEGFVGIKGQKVEEVGDWDHSVWQLCLRWKRARFEWESKLEEELMTYLAMTKLCKEEKDVQVWGNDEIREDEDDELLNEDNNDDELHENDSIYA